MSRSVLRLVGPAPTNDTGVFEVLLVRPGGSAVFRAEERDDAPVPLIDLRCAAYYRSTSCLMYGGKEYGMQVGVIASLIWRGRKIDITGPAVVLPDGLDLILPCNTLT